LEEVRGTILIVDDEGSIRDILCRKLESEGYNCVVAANGREALWKAFMQDFDLVLMDIKMPGLSGMEALPKMVTDHPDTCVVMLTAVADLETAVEAMKVGAYDYLPKPFNIDDLIMKVERALERRRLVLENREYQLRLEQRIERQVGQIRQYHSEATEALVREQEALTELEATRWSQKGFTRKLSQILALEHLIRQVRGMGLHIWKQVQRAEKPRVNPPVGMRKKPEVTKTGDGLQPP
jgi:DNA-binding NtrC family response regulator